MAKLLDIKTMSEEIKKQTKDEIKNYMIKPCLALIQIGNNIENEKIIEEKEKICNEVGIYFKLIKYDDKTKEIEIINKIIELNNDEYVHGITIQLPIDEKYNKDRLVSYISKRKDIDGLTDTSLGKVFNNKKGFASCLSFGIIELLKYNQIEIENKNVLLFGNEIPKSLIGLFLNLNTNLMISNNKELTDKADIIIIFNVEEEIKEEDIKKDAVIINLKEDLDIKKFDKNAKNEISLVKIKKDVIYLALLLYYSSSYI